MRLWGAQIIFVLSLLVSTELASAAGYYNLGATFQPVSPLKMTEYGYISGSLQTSECPDGTYAIGVSYAAGWVIDRLQFICSNSATVAGYLGNANGITGSKSCAGAGNAITSIQINSNGYMNAVCYIRMNCTDGTAFTQFGGSGGGGCGAWQTVQTCPQGYTVIGGISHASGYFSALGLKCRWMNR